MTTRRSGGGRIPLPNQRKFLTNLQNNTDDSLARQSRAQMRKAIGDCWENRLRSLDMLICECFLMSYSVKSWQNVKVWMKKRWYFEVGRPKGQL